MKKIISIILTLIILATPAFAISPDKAESLICLDRKYTFLDPENYVAMGGGDKHIALVDDEGGLWTFGSNKDGRLGIGAARNAYNAPIKVLDDVSRLKVNKDSNVAITTDGKAYGFGHLIGATPELLISGVRDADFFGILAYVTKSGSSHYVNYSGDEFTLCSGAKEIYILDSGSGGKGLTSSGSGISVGLPTMQDILNGNDFYIIVLKENGDLYEYGINRQGYADSGKLVAKNVKSVEAKGNGVVLSLGNGKFLTGTTKSGLKEVNIPDCVSYSRGGYYLKADGTLWREGDNSCVGKNVKLFSSLPLGAFMIHNDNSASAYSVNTYSANYGARLHAVNFSPVSMGRNSYYESAVAPIWDKTHELCGGEPDSYLNAKTISNWIGTNIESISDYSGYGTKAFADGEGAPYAISDLTLIMFTEMEIPCSIVENDSYAWTLAIIDGVTTFIDNSGNENGSGFDMGMFDDKVSDSSKQSGKYRSDYDWEFYDSWAANEVHGAYDYDLIDTFIGSNYTKAISRKNFCTLIRATIEKAYNKDIDAVIADFGKSGITVPFTDSKDADVIAMYKLGIVGGTSPTTFEPIRNITRQEAAKIITGLAKTLGADVSAPTVSFPDDSSVSAWARPYVNFVADRGIMLGKARGFDPLSSISAQETMLICYRYLTRGE